jgi:hypothetical protein
VVFSDHKELNSSKNPKGSFGSLFLIIKAKSLLETAGTVFLNEQLKNDQNKETYGHIFKAYQELEEALKKLTK